MQSSDGQVAQQQATEEGLNVGPLSMLFSRELVSSLISAKWQSKEQALRSIIETLEDYAASPMFTQACNYLLQLCFDEKNLQISI